MWSVGLGNVCWLLVSSVDVRVMCDASAGYSRPGISLIRRGLGILGSMSIVGSILGFSSA